MMNEPEPFAVDLSNNGIFLWHRKRSRKWEFLGSVPLNSGNLRQQLETLKQTILRIDAASNAAIVRIPSAEVKTFTLSPDPDENARWEVRIVASLEAAAGISIRELAFDIDRGNATPDISVAWTPMAVLQQAEAFVHLIGFIPTYYTTDLNRADFPRNPNFQITDYQSPPQSAKISPEAPITEAIQQPIDISQPTAAYPATNRPKATFGGRWFITLILLIAILITAIYYWPRMQETANSAPVTQENSYILPLHQSPPRIALKKLKQSYS
ncbi:MAG: hypothetical protein QM492_01120 [Rhodobacterales bacterium]